MFININVTHDHDLGHYNMKSLKMSIEFGN